MIYLYYLHSVFIFLRLKHEEKILVFFEFVELGLKNCVRVHRFLENIGFALPKRVQDLLLEHKEIIFISRLLFPV